MSEQVFCVNHPNTPTTLRCNKCGHPICIRCAVRTPVGYRCKSCVKNQQAVFYTALWYDYVIAAVVALVISIVARILVGLVPFILLVVFAGPLVGGAVAEAVRAATGRRRGQYTWLVVAVCMALVSLPGVIFSLLGQNVIGVLVDVVYAALAVGAAAARLRIGQK